MIYYPHFVSEVLFSYLDTSSEGMDHVMDLFTMIFCRLLASDLIFMNNLRHIKWPHFCRLLQLLSSKSLMLYLQLDPTKLNSMGMIKAAGESYGMQNGAWGVLGKGNVILAHKHDENDQRDEPEVPFEGTKTKIICF